MQVNHSKLMTSILALSVAAPFALATALAAPGTTAPNSAAMPAAPSGPAPSTPAPSASSSGTPSTQPPAAHHAALSRSRVEHVQEALNNNGAEISVDGIWGMKTEAALKEFQQQHSLKETGHLDQATMKQLNLKTSV